MSIEMHCHTLFSVDAYGTPENLVDTAADRGAAALAITEHNHLGSQRRAIARARQRSLRYITGIEFDAHWRGDFYHFLAFGFDLDNPALIDLVKRQHHVYAQRFDIALSLLTQAGHAVDRDALSQTLALRYPTHPEPVLNKWGCGKTLVESPAFLSSAIGSARLKQAYAQAETQCPTFCDFETVRDTVHAAGGVLLLAHVGKYLNPDQPDLHEQQSLALIQDLLAHGLDGFELYHPSNLALPFFPALHALALSRNCLFSAGSDCHNAPGTPAAGIASSPIPAHEIQTLLTRLDTALAKR